MTRVLDPATPDLLDRLERALGPDGIRPVEPRYLEEPRGRLAGRAAAVLRPRSTTEVATAVSLCADARVGIIPYSGGTGLVGGQIFGTGPLPVILSFERLNRIRDLDLTDNVMTAEAGCILADVHAAARSAGRLFPLSLASEGSARIGGLLGTNAGGVAVLRYGNARDLCLGVEAVMADGTVVHGLSRVMKDNLGYDLRHLLIGSEGTLGLITAASLRLHPLPDETVTAWIPVTSPDAALILLQEMRQRLGGTVSAFELLGARGLEFLGEALPDVTVPAMPPSPWFVLLEATDGRGARLADRLQAALEACLAAGLIADALVAQNDSQRSVFWAIRERIPEANRLIGSISSHDVSVPPSRLAAFIDAGLAALAAIDPALRVNCFGHLGDGNLHYNVFPPKGRPRGDFDPIRGAVKDCIHDLVHGLGGSVAAEHGVGRIKVADLLRYGDPAKVAAMQAIKAALDPNGILNPGAMLPAA